MTIKYKITWNPLIIINGRKHLEVESNRKVSPKEVAQQLPHHCQEIQMHFYI